MIERNFKVPILYEDKNILVVNKPAGVIIQGALRKDLSFVERIKDFIKKRENKPGNVFIGIVHRLDKVVSGALVLAKRSKAAKRLTEAFKEKKVIKIYLAEVEGILEGEGISKTWIAWDEVNKKAQISFKPFQKAKEALTYYKALQVIQDKKRTLVLLFPFTVKKHQLRSLLSFLGYPVVGDLKYGSKIKIKEGKAILLHSYFLKFPHPITKEPIAVIAPLPPYFSFKKVEKIVNVEFLDKMLEKLLEEIKNG